MFVFQVRVAIVIYILLELLKNYEGVNDVLKVAGRYVAEINSEACGLPIQSFPIRDRIIYSKLEFKYLFILQNKPIQGLSLRNFFTRAKFYPSLLSY